MSDSIRNQLLGLGFKPAPEPAKPARPPAPRHEPAGATAKPAPGKRREPRAARPARGEMDLGKAYALRAQREKEERIAAEEARQQAARARREAQAKLAAWLEGKALNVADADVVRHFEYGGKIKRVHVTEPQLRAINQGQLGVVQLNGRYLVVEASTLAEAEAIYPPAIALRVDPDAPVPDDPYADPQYRVPDDLIW